MTSVDILRGKYLKVDDTFPDLRVQLLDDGNPFNLTGYNVSVAMRRSDADSLSVDATATIDSETRGIVEYSWQSGDTDTDGTYLLEFTATNGSEQVTFPNNGYEQIYIEEEL